MDEGRLILISNRLPYQVIRDDDAALSLEHSVGGLATALGPLHEKDGSLWVGWTGTHDDALDPADSARVDALLEENGCVPVHLSADDVKDYYDGFSNSTIWPLFHGFPQHAHFEKKMWDAYVRANKVFCDAVLSIARAGDTFWIQDYHLMLLPAMLRKALPNASIGFFLHIPFPDYEGFRALPWRAEVLRGLLGCDLIGFHTYDYVRHFLSSVLRILGMENQLGSYLVDGRIVQVDAFPLGIDYAHFRDAVDSPEVAEAIADFPAWKQREGCKIMLSVERLDYSKGIPDRLRAFDAFLRRYPEWIGRVTLELVAVPSREDIASYHTLKKRVDELVGRINGMYSTPDWTPVDYYYRSAPFDVLVALYRMSDVMLVTPLRDGMNLVCKEYLATHEGRGGVLVLSEMAGAAAELGEAIIVNPFDRDGVAEAIHEALTMPEEEQLRRNAIMQKRIARYTSEKWIHEFLDTLTDVRSHQEVLNARLLETTRRTSLLEAYRSAHHRAILLDYDGTLVPFESDPKAAAPDERLLEILERLGSADGNAVAILSGRDRETLATWFGTLPVDLVAEHGVWYRSAGDQRWVLLEPTDDSWKARVRPALEDYVDRTPGSFLEEKEYSLVWHYRRCASELASRRAAEIRGTLAEVLGDMGLSLMDGNKVIEVKQRNIGKGLAAYRWYGDDSYDFILVAGDDVTDEDMFKTAPPEVWSIRVGTQTTNARFMLRDIASMRGLLEDLVALEDQAR